jgi:hypothetical protein
MKNVLRVPTIVTFATAAFASLSGLGSLTVQAQVHEMDLLELVLPARPAAAVPGGQTTPKPPSPVRPGTSLGVLPGGNETPLPIPDPSPPTLPATPPPQPNN